MTMPSPRFEYLLVIWCPNQKAKAKPPPTPRPRPRPTKTKTTTQLLSILPDHDASYIRSLLARRGASVESVVEMLLEGRVEEVGMLRVTMDGRRGVGKRIET